MFKRISTSLAILAISISAHATLIDFTDAKWKTAINGNTVAVLSDASFGQITLTASGGNFSFNDSTGEKSGCAASTGGSLLACGGDGIGIGNDEITELNRTQSNPQSITVSFDTGPVDINNIYLLDLFADDNGVSGRNETAVITTGSDTFYFTATSSATGGFYDTEFYGNNISSIILSGNADWFSDYALAGIEISPVPIPGAAILFGSALLGFFGFKRRRTI